VAKIGRELVAEGHGYPRTDPERIKEVVAAPQMRRRYASNSVLGAVHVADGRPLLQVVSEAVAAQGDRDELLVVRPA